MRLPAEPTFITTHRYEERFWNTDEMLEVLSIYYGSTRTCYPRSWIFRTIIAAHRKQYSQSMYGKGYGKDWQDHIKPTVIEYTVQGRLPLSSLKQAAEFIRQADVLAWTLRRAERASTVVPFKPPLRVALNK